MTFEEWFVENKQWDNYEDPVKAAWDYQQIIIDELQFLTGLQQRRIDFLENRMKEQDNE